MQFVLRPSLWSFLPCRTVGIRVSMALLDDDVIRKLLLGKITDPARRPFATIIRCADICNYSCTYCYSKPEKMHGLMKINVAEEMIGKILRYCGTERPVHFIWHGGEPLLAGLSFFERVAAVCRNYSEFKIENSIQTNGSLLNQELIDFYKANKFAISTSIDGPEDIHNINRLDKQGMGTFEHTFAAVSLLKNNGLKASCVCVLHRQNIDRLRDLYVFFRDNEINFRINPVVKIKGGANSYNALAVAPDEFGRGMCNLFDWWFDEDPTITIEPLNTILGNFMDDHVWGCDNHGQCLKNIISINPNGDIFPCGRFSSEEEFKLGNIIDCHALDEVFRRDLFIKLSNREASLIAGCRECEFGRICNGGCMITAYMANGNIFDPDYYCQGRRMTFSHVLKRLHDYVN